MKNRPDPYEPQLRPFRIANAVLDKSLPNQILETMLKYSINEREAKTLLKYQEEGYTILRNGAPDFIALKMNGDNIKESKAIEVKSPDDDLTYEQIIFRRFLEHHGIPYVVEVVP